jgi:simple sugar transport system permease protein
MIIGNWRPVGVLGGALLFGFFEALQLVGRDSVHGLMLFTTFVAGLAMILSIARRKLVPTITAVVVGVLFLIAYITVSKVPESLVLSLPYLATLIVLATASQRLRPPAMAGVPYRPGSAH